MLVSTFVTITDAKPETPRSLALTGLSNVPVTEPPVTTPTLSMAPPPATTDQVGVIDTIRPSASLPTAMNCCGSSPGGVTLGVTVMLNAEPGALGVCTSHAANTSVASVMTDSARELRLFGVFLMGLLQLR